ncbi:hypothetical protein BDZ91DRAFT_769048 [Kalaharituber pfeilii]|nr:hypothetical protein BDZ91DRAFT_769048 [Kalaharituber pfeilii]
MAATAWGSVQDIVTYQYFPIQYLVRQRLRKRLPNWSIASLGLAGLFAAGIIGTRLRNAQWPGLRAAMAKCGGSKLNHRDLEKQCTPPVEPGSRMMAQGANVECMQWTS